MAKKKATIKKPVSKEVYLVTYDVDSTDPVKEFKTMAEVKEFCEAVMQSHDDNSDKTDHKYFSEESYSVTEIRKDSLKIWKGTRIGKPVFKMEFID